jgi:hypothetical protein
MSNSHNLQIKKPISTWNKPLNANVKDLFKSLTKAAVGGATLNWMDAAKNLADAVTAVGFERNAGQLAWILIYRSVIRAIFKLVENHLNLIKSSPIGYWNMHELPQVTLSDLDSVINQLDLSLEQSELVIDEAFFNKPAELSFIQEIKTPLAQWFGRLGLSDIQANSIVDKLPRYFVEALNDEWAVRGDDYKYLTEAIDTPFTRANERERGWLRYSAWLQKQVEEPMFYESFGLRQVYIPLRGYYERKVKRKEFETSAPYSYGKTERVVISLEEELDAWLNRADPQDAIRIISGDPGSGKSSFCKMFAAKRANRTDQHILFIPLHLFDPRDDLIEAIGDFVRNDKILPHNPLDPEVGSSRLLIIFDGLDELSMQGKVAVEVAQQFIREIQKRVSLLNIHEPRLKILISGRELAVQSNMAEFRRSGQILRVLPYYIPLADRGKFVDSGNLLNRPLAKVSLTGCESQ